MAPSSRADVSIKMTPGREKQLLSNLAVLKEQYGVLLAEWARLTAAQREELLKHSPVLAGYVALFGVLGNG